MIRFITKPNQHQLKNIANSCCIVLASPQWNKGGNSLGLNSKYCFFNSNKQQTTEEPEVKGQGRNKQVNGASSIPLDSIILQYPFQFTLQSNNYKYYDPRFTQHPLKKNLQAAQKQHLHYVLQNFQVCINSGKIPSKQGKTFLSSQVMKSYIHSSLSSKLPNFFQSLKQSQLSLKITIDKQSITKTEGYMEIQPKDIQKSSAINLLNPKFLHQYTFQREKQLLLISEKIRKAKKSQEELLKQDVQEMMDEKSKKKQLREFFDQVQKSKTNDSERAMNFLMSKLKNLASKKVQKKRQQQAYLTSELIKGKVNFQVFYKNQLISEDENQLHTKWMYLVQHKEPETIKKSRKRILYDFQFWNRGTFFQVKDWLKDNNY